MSSINWNGVELQLIQTNRYVCTPIYSADGMDYLWTSHFYDFNCQFNPGASSYGPDGSAMPGYSPSDSFHAVRHTLQQPRGTLVINQGGSDPLIFSPRNVGGNSFPCDVNGGPFNRGVYVVKLGGEKTWSVNLKIETFMLECPDNSENPTMISNRYQQSSTISDDYMTTLITEGIVIFRQDVLEFAAANADAFRNQMLPPIPAGFKRQAIRVVVQPQRNQIAYSVMDQERFFDLGDTNPATGGSGVLDVNATYRCAGVRTAGVGAMSSMTYETVDVHVKGYKTASMWMLTQYAIALARIKLPIGDKTAGFITQAAISQSLTDKSVSFQISMQLGAVKQGNIGILNPKPLRIDEVFPKQGGKNPAPPNDNGTRGYYEAELAVQSLKTACGFVKPFPHAKGPDDGGKYATIDYALPPNVQVTVGNDYLPIKDYQFSDKQVAAAFTDYHIDTLYKTVTGQIFCPVASPSSSSSNSGSLNPAGAQPVGGSGLQPGNSPTPSQKPEVLTIHSPYTLMVVKGTAERINEPPLLPKSAPGYGDVKNLKLLDRNVILSAPELLGDGETYVVRASFEYTYILLTPMDDASTYAVGASPMYLALDTDNQFVPENFVDGILPVPDSSTAPNGGGGGGGGLQPGQLF